MWSRSEVVEHYSERTGLDVTPEQWRFYEVFGLFRLAVIAQQIWYRYFHGQTHNEAYAVFGCAASNPSIRHTGRPRALPSRSQRAISIPENACGAWRSTSSSSGVAAGFGPSS